MIEYEVNLLFPPRVIASLRDLRGEIWRMLVEKTVRQGPDALDQLSFVLMMARLVGCVTCHSGSHRSLRGCEACAQQAVRRFHGSDQELVELFEEASGEVQQHLSANRLPD
ncbi:MAG TPA: hypothetical protein VLA49_09700 [Anaerolineales bacterium]|nr:hypothetical protein [Anaerolineales bacterium]